MKGRNQMKKSLKVFSIILVLPLVFYMCTHRPSEEQFYLWLQDTYHIECKGNLTCKKELNDHSFSSVIETGSNIKDEYLLFNTIGKIYEDENGTRTTIKAIGVLGKYFTIIKDEKTINQS